MFKNRDKTDIKPIIDLIYTDEVSSVSEAKTVFDKYEIDISYIRKKANGR